VFDLRGVKSTERLREQLHTWQEEYLQSATKDKDNKQKPKDRRNKLRTAVITGFEKLRKETLDAILKRASVVEENNKCVYCNDQRDGNPMSFETEEELREHVLEMHHPYDDLLDRIKRSCSSSTFDDLVTDNISYNGSGHSVEKLPKLPVEYHIPSAAALSRSLLIDDATMRKWSRLPEACKSVSSSSQSRSQYLTTDPPPSIIPMEWRRLFMYYNASGNDSDGGEAKKAASMIPLQPFAFRERSKLDTSVRTLKEEIQSQEQEQIQLHSGFFKRKSSLRIPQLSVGAVMPLLQSNSPIVLQVGINIASPKPVAVVCHSPPEWLPDPRQRWRCPECNEEYGTAAGERHHCRGCGKVFCTRCSSSYIRLLKYGYTVPQKVCSGCRVASYQFEFECWVEAAATQRSWMTSADMIRIAAAVYKEASLPRAIESIIAKKRTVLACLCYGILTSQLYP